MHTPTDCTTCTALKWYFYVTNRCPADGTVTVFRHQIQLKVNLIITVLWITMIPANSQKTAHSCIINHLCVCL